MLNFVGFSTGLYLPNAKFRGLLPQDYFPNAKFRGLLPQDYFPNAKGSAINLCLISTPLGFSVYLLTSLPNGFRVDV